MRGMSNSKSGASGSVIISLGSLSLSHMTTANVTAAAWTRLDLETGIFKKQRDDTLVLAYVFGEFYPAHAMDCFLGINIDGEDVLEARNRMSSLTCGGVNMITLNNLTAGSYNVTLYLRATTSTATLAANNNRGCLLIELDSLRDSTTYQKIYPGAEVKYLSAKTGNAGDFYTYASGTSNANSRTAYIPIDLTNYSTITIKSTVSAYSTSSYAGVWLTDSTSGNQEYPYYTIGAGSSSSYYKLMNRITNAGNYLNFTWDVSSYTGTYYICIGAYFNGSSASTAGIKIHSIIAS